MNKDEPTGIIDNAKAQAAKIIQNANLQAKQILEAARAEGGMTAETVEEKPKSWYYSADGDSGVFEVGKQPKGWTDSPETAKNPPKKAPRKKAVKK